MKKIINRINVVLACIGAALVCMGLAFFGFNNLTVTAADTDFYMAGAEVRYMTQEQSDKDQNGIRFAVAVSDTLFANLSNAEKTGFAENVTVGGLVVPADLAKSDVLTKDTELVEGNYAIKEVTFSYADFEDSTDVEGYMVAYISLYNFPVSNYNRNFLASAYYQTEAVGAPVYADTVSGCMAQVAKASAAIETDETKKATLETYVKDYAVKFYVNGSEYDEIGVKYGEAIASEDVPDLGASVIFDGWYVDEDCTQKFDTATAIKGTTKLYAKSQSVAELTDGVFETMTSDYTIGEDADGDLTLTQTLLNQTNVKNSLNNGEYGLGLAKFNVDGTKDYEVSVKMKLSTPGQDTWIDKESNTMVGLTFYGENGADSYVYSYRAGNFVFKRNTNSADNLHDDTSDSGRTSFWDQKANYLSSGVTEFTMTMVRRDTQRAIFINNLCLEEQTVPSGVDLTPSIFSFTFEEGSTVSVIYSDFVVKSGDEVTAWNGMFSSMTTDYRASKDGSGNLTLTQTVQNNSTNVGLAKFNVDGTKDYAISMSVAFSEAAGPGYDNGTDGQNKNNRVGVSFYGEGATSYNYGYSMIWYNAVRMINTSEKSLYNDTDYTVNGSSARKSFYSEREQFTQNGAMGFELTMKKVGNTITVSINNYTLETLTVADGANLVPCLFSYNLKNTQTPVTVTYSNIAVKTGTEVTA
ncbi:MAG: InlB B-repeat-containing protein [Clostridia bacterium]|nr:InlB B-repeat-containing protein [Clostridia bacterium]